MAKHVDIHRPNALMAAYKQSKTQRPKIVRMDLQPPPPNPMFIPGYGQATGIQKQRNWALKHPRVPDGPYIRRVSRPKGRTKPTPGSAYRRRKPTVN